MNPQYEAKKPELTALLDPKHTALLVIDPQKGYCDPNEVLPRLLDTDTDELQAMIPRANEFVLR
jgi:nicotinamidase-related amidase|tara:strand:+ start:1699 stop:1890 length:192 start_codon:yes stop_codon:yes gene_type:complete